MSVMPDPAAPSPPMPCLAAGFAMPINRMLSRWPVAQLGARVFDMVDDAMKRDPIDQLVALYLGKPVNHAFTPSGRDLVQATLTHHGVGSKGGAASIARIERRGTYAAFTHPED